MNLPIDYTDPHWIAALSSLTIALFLLVLTVVVAVRMGRLVKTIQIAVEQIHSAGETRLKQETIAAVRRYETDPQLRESIRKLFNKSDQGTDYGLLDESDRFHIITVLNFFDGIACGIEQGILVEPLVRDYLQVVLDKAVRVYLRGESGPTWRGGRPIVEIDGYETLLNMHQRWNTSANETLYQMLH